MRTRQAGAGLVAALLATLVTLTGVTAPAGADDAASITHLQRAKGGIDVLVSVPADAQVDLGGVTVSVDGTPLTAAAGAAGTDGAVRRTAILLIDTSDSMHTGGRLAAAEAAAHQYVDALPADVYLGIVTFASGVTTALAPTQDHSKAAAVIDGLTLSHGTALYDGVVAATKAVGSDGQRSLLLLTDGKDVGSSATLDQAVSAVTQTGVLLDAVAVQDGSQALPALQSLATAGKGALLTADPAALRDRFAQEAAVLVHQVLVHATFPPGFSQTAGRVTVSLPTASGSLSASAIDSDLQDAVAPARAAATALDAGHGLSLPHWVVYAGAACVAIGLLVLGLALVPRRTAGLSPEDRVTAYTAAMSRRPSHRVAESEQALAATAKNAAADLLRRNASLEARIATRLDAAGSELKPAEWLLLHTGIAAVAALVGLVLGGLVLGIVLLGVGIVGPWLYLGYKRGRRRKAFGEALPDILQLMSGSLAAGLSLAQSVDTVVREGAEPVASEFRRVLVETRLGVELEEALDGIADRFESDDFKWVVMAIRIQRQVGGNLAELLDTVAATMRERAYLRRQVDTLAAEGKLSAVVLGVLPPGILLYLMLTNRSYVSPLFTDPRGLVLLAFGIGWLGVGIFWMSKLVKVEV